MARATPTKNGKVIKWKETLPLPDDENDNTRTLYRDKNGEYVLIIATKKKDTMARQRGGVMEIYHIEAV